MVIQPVILCGGSGTRLWPLSREKYPKQLLRLFGDDTLLQMTAKRVGGLEQESLRVLPPAVISNIEYRFVVEKQLKEINCDAEFLLEPISKNTAPALTVAALNSQKNGIDPILLIMPADHMISNEDAFQQAICTGAEKAETGAVVCFGITPNAPEVGFGYIKTRASDSEGIYELESFVEKPDLDRALAFLESGEYYWNSGIFQLKASTWLSILEQANPTMLAACESAFDLGKKINQNTLLLDESSFSASPEDSIDYAVMESLGEESAIPVKSYVVPFDVNWSDVGSWGAVWDISEKDDLGNAKKGRGESLFHQAKNNLVYTDTKRLVSLLGAEDIVVIDTEDALLIAHKDKLAEMRPVVKKLKQSHAPLMENGRKVVRPWGTYDSIDSGPNFQVKRIVVNPGETLSLQMHYHRAEHWVVVRGTGRITCGDKVFLLSENESTYIPMGEVHRLENPGKIPLEVIEVQSGQYLGEDDIVRFEDHYGRCENKVTEKK